MSHERPLEMLILHWRFFIIAFQHLSMSSFFWGRLGQMLKKK